MDKNYWNELVQNLAMDISKGNRIEGLIKAIEKCGKSLADFFPIKEDDTNEISDQLITDLKEK